MVGKMGHIRHTSRVRDEGVLLLRARFPFVPPTAGRGGGRVFPVVTSFVLL